MDNSNSFGSKSYYLHEFSKVTDSNYRNLMFISHVNILFSDSSSSAKFYTDEEKSIYIKNLIEVFESIRYELS